VKWKNVKLNEKKKKKNVEVSVEKEKEYVWLGDEKIEKMENDVIKKKEKVKECINIVE
jgi:hypothetical protein